MNIGMSLKGEEIKTQKSFMVITYARREHVLINYFGLFKAC